VATGIEEWEAFGQSIDVGGEQVWCARLAAAADGGDEAPILALHGFPTCSYDWTPVLPALQAARDVVVVDVPGFGLSAKPDRRYGLGSAADAVEAAVAHFGITHLDLLTHDMGDSVGGELLARDLDGSLGFSVGRRVLTNGSIYLEMAHLTDGQQLLLSLADERNDAVGADGGAAFARGVTATFAPGSPVAADEIDALTRLAARDGGLGMLPRTIRYIEDRRADERRFTGAIESHPSPVGVIWGALDPVSVVAMAHRFVDVRPEAPLIVLDDVGHYPMLEAPDRFAAAVRDLLSRL